MAQSRRSISIALPFVAVGICTVIKDAIPAIRPPDSFILFFVAVALSAWVGGRASGVLATLLASATAAWFASMAGGVSAATLVRMVLFSMEAIGLTLLVDVVRKQQARLHDANHDVESARVLLQNIIETAPSAIVATHPDGTFFLFNQAAERLTGYKRDEVIGRPLLDVFVPDEWRDKVLSRFSTSKPDELKEPHRNPWRMKNGEQRLIEWRCALLPVESGNQIIGVGVDVTALQALEEQRARLSEAERGARERAEEAVRAKDRFLATISHELRGPLTAILGWAQLLGTSHDPELFAQGIHAIEENARAQTKLVEDLLDFARIASGRAEIEKHPVVVDDVILSSVAAFIPEAQKKHLEIRTELGGPGVHVAGDERRLRQVFMNVLQNALRYTDSGQITIRSERENGRIRVLISDTGRGIAADFLPQIFDRFTQESTLGAARSGLGLGLAIVKEIVTLHGGSVSAASDGPGKGAAFAIELPVAS